MRKIILKESELIKLIETAMDLDIYSQEPNLSTGSVNKDAEQSIEDIMDKLKELLNMLQSGKKVDTSLKQKIHRNLDSLNKTFEEIKTRP